MTSSVYKLIIYIIAINFGISSNAVIRNNIDKYLRQDFLKEPRNTTNFFIHVSGLIGTITKITAALLADTTFGSFKTMLFLFPFIFAAQLTNICSIFAKESLRLSLFKWTKILSSFVTSGVGAIRTPFYKYQIGDAKAFELYFNIWYYIFNVYCFTASLFIPSLFKTYVNSKTGPSTIIWFILPPFIISMLAHSIFFLFHKILKKEVIIKKNLWVYVRGLFYPKNITKNGARLHYTQLKYIFSLFFVEVAADIVMDLLGACLIDFADDARETKINIFTKEILVTGQSLDAINPLTVLIFTPIIFGFIYPYVIPKYSDHRKLTISLILSGFSIAFGGFLHCMNPQKGGIDKSITHSILWHGVIVYMQAISEIMIFTIIPREVAKNSPLGYKNLCFALYGAADGVSSLICMIVTKCKFIKSVNKISVYMIITLPGPYFAYKAYLFNKEINEIKSKLEIEEKKIVE